MSGIGRLSGVSMQDFSRRHDPLLLCGESRSAKRWPKPLRLFEDAPKTIRRNSPSVCHVDISARWHVGTIDSGPERCTSWNDRTSDRMRSIRSKKGLGWHGARDGTVQPRYNRNLGYPKAWVGDPSDYDRGHDDDGERARGVVDPEHTTAGYESELEHLDREIAALVKGTQLALTAARKAQRASAQGNQSELVAAIVAVRDRLADLHEKASELTRDADYDLTAWMQSGGYARELMALAAASHLPMVESDSKLLCYPSVLQVMPAEQAITIDRKRVREVRPSRVVDVLRANSQRRSRFRAEAFLEALASAYDLWIAHKGGRHGSHVKLMNLYSILTLLNGSRAYSKQEFARDIYLLDQSGLIETKDGRILRFAASATTRGGGVLETVAKGGQVKIYSTIALEGPND